MEKIFRSSNLADILKSLEKIVESSNSYELNNELANMRNTYVTLLRYMVQGVDDPNATKLYSQLVEQSYVLGERAQRLNRIQTKTNEKYCITLKYLRTGITLDRILLSLQTHCSALRNLQENPNDRESIQTRVLEEHHNEREQTLTSMFDYVWTSDVWHKSDYETATELINSDSIFIEDKCIFISAVTLSLLETFDQRKLMLLFDAYLQTDVRLNQRAIVGIILVLRHYDTQIKKYSQISARLSLYLEDPKFINDTFRILMQLQYASLTDTINSKMRNDIIPAIMQSTQFRRTQFGIEEIDNYMTQNGENPEWHHREEDDKANSKIQEIAELQMDGADVYMSSFAHLKGNSFFHTLSHWFTPFYKDHPLLTANISKNQETEKSADGTSYTNIFDKVVSLSPFCDSDKYSFYFMTEQIGSMGRDMLSNSLASQIKDEDIEEVLKSKQITAPKAKHISRNYICDLYRFFTLYPYHTQFDNPFDKNKEKFTPLNIQMLNLLLQHKEKTHELAEFLMRKEFYTDALNLFMEQNPQNQESDVILWQQIGFCQQKTGLTEEALNSYTTAFQLNSNSNWTLKHLAQTAYQLKQYSNAEIYYDMLLETDSDNLRYIIRKIDCLEQQKKYEEELPLLYKAVYLKDEESLNDRLAWVQLLAGNTEKSIELFNKILTKESADTVQRYTTLTHSGLAQFLSGNLKESYNNLCLSWKLFQTTDKAEQTYKREFIDSVKILCSQSNPNVKQLEMLYDAVILNAEMQG